MKMKFMNYIRFNFLIVVSRVQIVFERFNLDTDEKFESFRLFSELEFEVKCLEYKYSAFV